MRLVCMATSLLLLLGNVAIAQKKQDKSITIDQLRKQLTSVLGPTAIIVKDQLTRRSNWHGAQLFWLPSIQPKQVGHYSIKYRYKYNDPLYSHVERELLFRVGEKGCLRNPLGNGYYAKFCLGDTVILPIAIENYTEHEFTLKFTKEEIKDEVPDAGITPPEPQPDNPLSDHLVYVSSNSGISPHRNGGYTTNYSATFEARKPGRFNLQLSNFPPSGVLTGVQGGTTVIVIDRTTPITAIAAREEVEGFTVGYDGREYVSSTGGTTSYITDVLIIQTGDRFTFHYSSVSVSAKREREERGQKTVEEPVKPPFIQKLSFWFDGNSSYNEWIKDSLP